MCGIAGIVMREDRLSRGNSKDAEPAITSRSRWNGQIVKGNVGLTYASSNY